MTLLRPGPAPGPRYRTPDPARHHEHDISRPAVNVNTIASACTPTTGLFVLTESDAVMLILSAGQQLLTLPDLYDEVRRGNAAIGSHRERSAQLQYIYCRWD